MQNLKNLLEQLLQHQIDFVLVGGFAGVVHGSTLVTQDLDICMALTDANIKKLREALHDLEPVHRMNQNANLSFLDLPIDTKDLQNIYLKAKLGLLDIMSKVPPVGEFS